MTRLRFFIAQGFMAFLPALLVMLVATDDPHYAANLSVAFGTVGAVFSISYFGQQAYVSIRGFQAIPGRHAISFRFLFSVLACATSLALIGHMDLGVSVAAFAVALKLSEGIVDVWLGIRIHSSTQELSSKLYSSVAVVRAALVGIPVVVIGARTAVESRALVEFLALLAAVGYWMAHQESKRLNLGGSYLFSPKKLGLYCWEMRSFVSATAASAVLWTLPRILLPYSNADGFSSPALSLSIVPIFGLACQAIWLSNLKGLTANLRRQAPRFLIEIGVCVALIALLGPAWQLLARTIYHLEGEEAQAAFATTALVGALFSASVTASNLFKVTPFPRNESMSYLAGIGAMLISVFVLGQSVNAALLVASAAVVTYLMIAFTFFPNLRRKQSVSAPGEGAAIFVRLCNSPIPRVVRMMTVVRELGYHPHFFGAHRVPGLPTMDEWEGFEVERIGPSFPLLNGRRPLLYISSVFRYGAALIWNLARLRPRLVHVSDFELFWPARVYTALTRTPLLYNIHDNVSQRYRCPRIVAAILNFLEGLAARAATVTLVPEDFRRAALPSWCRSNVHVIRNTPIDPGCSLPNDFQNRPVTLFFGGWIDAGRGLRELAQLAANEPKMHLLVAGEGDAELLAEVAAMNNVDTLGFLTHAEVMAKTAGCDFVCALYDPARPINRFAASNKIAEALAVGRPLLINAELEIAKLLKPYGCTITTEYGDLSQVGAELLRLRADKGEYDAMCARARQAYEDHFSWGVVHKASLSAFAAAGIYCSPELRPES